MALSLRNRLCVSSPYEMRSEKKNKEMKLVGSSDVLAYKNEFKGRSQEIHSHLSIHAQTSICVPKVMRWWEKASKPNMIEIKSTQHLVDLLLHAGDNLVVVDFFSPGCGGCKALHPKICQFVELHPNVTFLKVNYEQHRLMCESMHIHVLPFFRFYRGAQGRVSSFSCTTATIKKFKDAIAKHGTESSFSLGPAKGLDEEELINLGSNREINISYPFRSSMPADLSLNSFNEVEVRKDLMASVH